MTTDETTSEVYKAARAGDLFAMKELSRLYADGREGMPRSTYKSFDWMLKAAENGDVDAQCEIARFYEFGFGVPADEQKSLDWYKRAFSNGSAEACFTLAVWFDRGQHLAKSRDNAIAFYEEGAKRGSPGCQLHLGLKLLHGLGIARDGRRAMDLLEKAAEGGQGTAFETLGVMYLSGEFVPRNPQMAFEMFGRALLYFEIDPSIAVGNAAIYYALCLLTGTGCDEDRAMGTAILKKAAETGNTGSAELLQTKIVKDPQMQVYYGVDGSDIFKKPARPLWDISNLLDAEVLAQA